LADGAVNHFRPRSLLRTAFILAANFTLNASTTGL
jgi:hypothetical protein